MSYDAIENSVDLGSPVTLFEFTYGPAKGDVYRYSTTINPVTLAGRAWKPEGLTHGDITSAGTLDKAELEVTASANIEVARLFLAAAPSQPVLLNIFRQHKLTNTEGWDEFKRVWTGRVLSVERQESEVVFKCEPVSTSARRVGLRRYFQYGCPHVLYGRACGVPREAHTAQLAVTAVENSAILTVVLIGDPKDVTAERLVGGIFSLSLPDGRTALRSIVGASGGLGSMRLQLMSALPDLAPGLRGSVSRGCKHTFDDCKTFENTENYGGCPNIPTKDAFRSNTF